jgi:hypothetical protein
LTSSMPAQAPVRAPTSNQATGFVSTQSHHTGIERVCARYRFEPVHNLLTVHLVAAG